MGKEKEEMIGSVDFPCFDGFFSSSPFTLFCTIDSLCWPPFARVIKSFLYLHRWPKSFLPLVYQEKSFIILAREICLVRIFAKKHCRSADMLDAYQPIHFAVSNRGNQSVSHFLCGPFATTRFTTFYRYSFSPIHVRLFSFLATDCSTSLSKLSFG